MTRRPSPGVAATLSFLLPGLGQLALGAIRRGILLLAPAAAIVAVGAVAAVPGAPAVLGLLLTPGFLIGALVANIVLAAAHVYAVLDAGRSRISDPPEGSGAPRHGTTALVAVLVIATIGLHGAIEVVGYRAYTTLDDVFSGPGGGDGWVIPDPSFEPTPSPTPSPTPTPGPTPSPSPTPTPLPTPSPTPGPAWAEDDRLDLLLIGSDSGPGRWSLRTDTMIVLSVQVSTGRAALFGIPRNLTDVPLAPESKGASPNGRFPGLLNALYVYAMGHPRYFPGGEARGFRAVTGAVQELVGVELDGAVVVDLLGFVKLVDALDGLWIDVQERLVDQSYPLEDGGRKVRIVIEAGCQLLDGRMSLAYARSRHQDSDYGRMKRQQRVLVALAHQVDPIALLPRIPELLDIAGDHLWTTLDRSDIPALADLAARVDPGSVETVTIAPPDYPSHMTTAWIKRIRAVVRGAFDDPAPEPSPSAEATPPSDERCLD